MKQYLIRKTYIESADKQYVYYVVPQSYVTDKLELAKRYAFKNKGAVTKAYKAECRRAEHERSYINCKAIKVEIIEIGE